MAVVLKTRSILLPMGIGKLLRGMVVLCIKLGKFIGVVKQRVMKVKYREIGV